MLSYNGMPGSNAPRSFYSTIPILHNRLETLLFQKSRLVSLAIRFGHIPPWLKKLPLSTMCVYGDLGLLLGTTRNSELIIVTRLTTSTKSHAIVFTSTRLFMSPNPSSTACKSITTTSPLRSLVATKRRTTSILFLRVSKIVLAIFKQRSLIFGIAPSPITSVSKLRYLFRLTNLLK